MKWPSFKKSSAPSENSKIAYLRGRVFKRITSWIIMSGSAIFVAATVSYIVTDWEDDANTQNQKLQQVQMQSNTLSAKLDMTHQSSGAYAALMARQNGTGLDLDRDKLKDLVEKLRTECGSTQFSLSASAISDSKDTALIKPSVKVVDSKISLSLSGLTDNTLITCLTQFMEQSPGYIQFTGLKLERVGRVNPELLQKLAQGGASDMATLKADYDWRGIREISSSGAEKPHSTPTAARGL